MLLHKYQMVTNPNNNEAKVHGLRYLHTKNNAQNALS